MLINLFAQYFYHFQAFIRRRRNDVPFFLSFAFHPRRGRFQISMPEFFFEARKWELSKRASEEEGATEKAISPQITEKIPLPLSLVLLREYPSFSSRCSPFPEEKALSGQNAERPRRRSFAPDPNSLQGTVFDQITGTGLNKTVRLLMTKCALLILYCGRTSPRESSAMCKRVQSGGTERTFIQVPSRATPPLSREGE